MHFALRFISGKYQGGEFPLLWEREVVVGRSSELDMVLVEDMVSRKHAKIYTVNNQIAIMDLGSTNGTFVNGEKIKKTKLKEGDRILIGTSILKVISIDAKNQVTAEEARQKLEEVGKADNKGSTMSGTLAEVPIRDLLQLFSTSKRTGILHIRSHLGYGKIYLRDGNIFYASIDDEHELGPMKAFCRVVDWSEGSFSFGPPEETTEFPRELADPTEALLLEAVRQQDELKRISAELPRSNVRLHIPCPLSPALTMLLPCELELLQLVHNHRVTQLILDKSRATDFEASSALLNLITRGYVAPVDR